MRGDGYGIRMNGGELRAGAWVSVGAHVGFSLFFCVSLSRDRSACAAIWVHGRRRSQRVVSKGAQRLHPNWGCRLGALCRRGCCAKRTHKSFPLTNPTPQAAPPKRALDKRLGATNLAAQLPSRLPGGSHARGTVFRKVWSAERRSCRSASEIQHARCGRGRKGPGGLIEW